MRVENRRRDSGCAVAFPFDVPSHDVRIELTVAEVKGEPRGVVAIGFGKDSTSGDQYSFAMMTDGDVELGETIRGRFRQLRYERRIGPIRADRSSERRMAVEMRGGTIDFYLNDERVMTYATDRTLANGLTLGLGPRSTVVFARLVVKRTGIVASTP
jgi:hypothetical protein